MASIACALGAAAGRSYGIRQFGSMFGAPGHSKSRQRLRNRSGVTGACRRALAMRRRRPDARWAAGWGGNRHSSLRRRRHVATFALTCRVYCLCRTATTRLNFCGEGPRLNGQGLAAVTPTVRKISPCLRTLPSSPWERGPSSSKPRRTLTSEGPSLSVSKKSPTPQGPQTPLSPPRLSRRLTSPGRIFLG